MNRLSEGRLCHSAALFPVPSVLRSFLVDTLPGREAVEKGVASTGRVPPRLLLMLREQFWCRHSCTRDSEGGTP